MAGAGDTNGTGDEGGGGGDGKVIRSTPEAEKKTEARTRQQAAASEAEKKPATAASTARARQQAASAAEKTETAASTARTRQRAAASEAEKKPVPAASTARTRRQPVASDDMPGAGDVKGPGEEGDVNARESEKKPEPAASTKVSAASTQGEGVTQLAEREEHQRELMAERYSLPVEVFTAGSSSGCALIGSIEAFQAAADTSRPFYVMPYLSPDVAVKIQSEMEKRTWVRPLLMNPDMLASKVAVIDEIQAEIRSWDQEDTARAKAYHHRLACGLVGFRAQMQHRLLFTYAAKGEWVMAHKYLKLLYPNSDEHARIEQFIANLKSIHHCSDSDESDIEDRIYDLISLLSFEDRTEVLYKSQSSLVPEQITLLKKVRVEPSLIGATHKEMTVSALKKLLLDLVSCAVTKGHLAHETGSYLALGKNVQKLRKAGHDHINGIIMLLHKKQVDFDKIASIANLLKDDATLVGAQGLKIMCDALLESCKQRSKKECTEALPKIEQEYIDICGRLEKISELQDLIHLIVSGLNLTNK